MSTICTSLTTTYDSSWGKQVFSLDDLHCVLNQVSESRNLCLNDLDNQESLESFSR